MKNKDIYKKTKKALRARMERLQRNMSKNNPYSIKAICDEKDIQDLKSIDRGLLKLFNFMEREGII
jgi:hypothetical protein